MPRTFKPKPVIVFREENHTPGRGSVRQTFDYDQYVHWRDYSERYPNEHVHFYIGRLTWEDADASE